MGAEKVNSRLKFRNKKMGLVENLQFLITNKPFNNNQLLNSNYISTERNLFSRLWFDRNHSHRRSLIFLTIFIALACYILVPSLPFLSKEEKKMFSKRPDKHTTGLINMRNDCFANSSIQAYSSLPGLTEYLNKIISAYKRLLEIMDSHAMQLDSIVSIKEISIVSQAKFKPKPDGEAISKIHIRDHFSIVLHIALARIVKRLQETQMSSRTISVWSFLHELERIYDAKISKSQHDAHELTQLINETLENENLNSFKILKKLKQHFISNVEILKDLDDVDFPEFPFSGLVLSQMKCLNCSFVSKPHFAPFLMLTLHPPQTSTTDLDTLLNENEAETINGYQCLKCRLLKISANEVALQKQGLFNDPADQAIVDKLLELNVDNQLFINEDLPADLEKFIKDYDKNGVVSSKITSNVFRTTTILKPPKVFGLHLSRSAFNGVTISRNPCRVTFNDKLTLSIGKEYLEELKKFQASASLLESTSAPHLKVLTTDVNDMEDESNQREDFDEKGEEELTNLDESGGSTTTEGESQTLEDSDDVSNTSEESAPPSMSTANTSRTIAEGKCDTLNNAPISQDQTISLQGHFRKFRFNDSNVYKYRLKAIIRHQGSHTQGHYECYRRKPLFVKDQEGNILKLSPEIDEMLLDDFEASKTNLNNPKSEKVKTGSRGSSSREGSEGYEERSGNFRKKLSTMMGRRQSIMQADPNNANLREIIDSGLATPAEVLVDEGDYFLGPTPHDIQNLLNHLNLNKGTHKLALSATVKMKKIPSLMKNPYWRIGDSQVTEESRSAILFETASVYMLYYERIDRNQIHC